MHSVDRSNQHFARNVGILLHGQGSDCATTTARVAGVAWAPIVMKPRTAIVLTYLICGCRATMPAAAQWKVIDLECNHGSLVGWADGRFLGKDERRLITWRANGAPERVIGEKGERILASDFERECHIA